MSTAPGSEATFIQGNQSLAEQDASHSALFYLFQEVSRLASSPVNKSFLDTNSPSKWLNETSRRDHFIIKQEEDSAHLSQTLSGSCQQSLSGMLPYDQMSKMTEESHSDKVATLPHCECNSPWKVLSLINLQCERLLHRGDVEGSDPSSVSLTVKSDHPAAKLLSPPGDVTELGYRCDTINVKDTLKPLLTEGQEVIAVSHAEDVSRVVSNNKPQCCVKDSKEDFSVQRQTEEKTDCVIPELVEENATESYQLQHKDQREVMFSVNRQLEWIQECKKHCLSPEQDILNVRVSENALLQVESHNASLNTQLPFKSNEDTSVALSKSDLTLDYNANIALDLKLPCDTQLLPLSTAVFFNATESCYSVPKSDHAVTDSGCMFASKEERSTSFEQLKSVMLNADLKRPLQKEEIAPASSHQWRTKTPRKQPRPSRSVDVQDPDFQGVTFSMGTELDDNREQCRLLITSKYSKELFKSTRKSKLRTRTSQKSVTTSNSDDESDPMSTVSKDKVCASCCTRKTPMWRDAEDGTPLCNACGIRYKKYRVRCVNCWHIPRKEGNSNSSCLKCGNSVKLTSAQRKHTT